MTATASVAQIIKANGSGDPFDLLPAFRGAQISSLYGVEVRSRHRIMGGTPKDPDIVLNWLATKLADDTTEAQLIHLVQQTLKDQGIPIPSPDEEQLSMAQMRELAETFVVDRKTVGFKRLPSGELCLEGRQVKAMLREAVNILYAGEERWGNTRKGPKSFFVERVFVPDVKIPLGVYEPSGIETVIGHVSGPQGPRSTMTRYEYVEGVTFRWTMTSLQDCVEESQWLEILTLCQDLGLGAVRSQSYGTFDIVRFGKIQGAAKAIAMKRTKMKGAAEE